MSTQPQLSPLEQWANQATPSQPSQSGLSPLEQWAKGQQQPSQAAQGGPDLRPQRVNQRTGQPTTIEDPEGVDKIAADPNFAQHTAQGAAVGALGAGSAYVAPLIGMLAPHFPDLNKAWKIAMLLGGGSATVDHMMSVLHVLHGKQK